jgi:hypothetical protein
MKNKLKFKNIKIKIIIRARSILFNSFKIISLIKFIFLYLFNFILLIKIKMITYIFVTLTLFTIFFDLNKFVCEGGLTKDIAMILLRLIFSTAGLMWGLYLINNQNIIKKEINNIISERRIQLDTNLSQMEMIREKLEELFNRITKKIDEGIVKTDNKPIQVNNKIKGNQ